MVDLPTSKKLMRVRGYFALRYGLAFALVAGALSLDLLLHNSNLAHPFAAFALSVIVITFWYGSTKPGILAVLLSSIIHGFTSSLFRVLHELVFLTFAIVMIGLDGTEALELAIIERTALPKHLYFEFEA